MDNLNINIPKDFSRCPGARYRNEGDYSGEEFREEYLVPKLKEAIENGVRLEVILDGSSGYSTAFIEESFGGLIRINQFNLNDLRTHLIIISKEDESYIEDINQYIENAWKNR